MSGLEVAGLVLGAFPLLISAMEHYEGVKKVSSTWWRIKRAHKRDLGRVKDCQLKFKLNLKELLLPLVLDGVVNKGEYELLLASPGGDGWREEQVEDALGERLAECHERYVEILGEILETMAQLSKECRVDDTDFQDVLKRRGEKIAPPTPNQKAQTYLMIKANIAFEAKRAKYSLTGSKRDDLLAEIEGYNTRLQDVLASNDRISNLTQHSRPPAHRRVNNKSLNFWRHAASIFRILDDLWSCNCRSNAYLWLQHHTFTKVDMKMQLRLCHGQQSFQVCLASTPSLQIGRPKASKSSGSVPSVAIHSSAASTGTSRLSCCSSTVTMLSQSAPASSVSSLAPNLTKYGICKSCSAVHGSQEPEQCLGNVNDGENEYAIYPTVERIPMADSTTLADLLRPGSSLKLTRVQRYGIALTLASSHLQLHSTPWIKEHWTSQDVRFPTSTTDCSDKSLQGEPYILAPFDGSGTNLTQARKDRTFSTLGIVLLELCFGSRLEQHRLWANPAYASSKADPMIRQAVACEWLEDVEGEAGEDYATAVNWTLKQAPAIIKDDKWRAEFARNVVQPLQQCYEYLNAKKSSS